MTSRADLDATLEALERAAYQRGWDAAMRHVMAQVAQMQPQNTDAAAASRGTVASQTAPTSGDQSGHAAAPVPQQPAPQAAVTPEECGETPTSGMKPPSSTSPAGSEQSAGASSEEHDSGAGSPGAAQAGDGRPTSPAPSPANLTKRERCVLTAIIALQNKRDRPTQSQIGKRAGIPPSGTSHYTQKLEAKGYLRREGESIYERRYVVLRRPDGQPIEPEPDEPLPKPAKPRSNARTRPFRRFDDKPALDPESVTGLDDDHPAVTEGRTLFPTTVVDPADSPRLLVSGGNSRKLGDRVVKGPWSGMPIYQLTLEERATCPRSCHHWASCYGSGMPLARRHRHGQALVDGLERELAHFQRRHPDGFVVRLHVLGDFYSVEYVEAWARWLEQYPALRVFGFTAWPRESEIGRQIQATVDHYGYERFAIRFSSEVGQPGGVTTLWQKPEDVEVPDGTIICPAQTGGTDCCGSCGLCWHPEAKGKTIAFVAHGGRPGVGRKSNAEPPADNGKAAEPWPAEKTPADPGPVDDSDRVERFASPKDRRCSACSTLFKSHHSHDELCPDCASKVVKCPGVGDGPLPHYHPGSMREMNERKKRRKAEGVG